MAETQGQPGSPGFSGRLKYANPQDLPSFPSSGLRKDGAAAGAAASLGWANQKSVDPWRPDKSDAASAAAFLAKDHKMAPQWQPDSSSAGAKAALLATTRSNSVKAQPQSNDGGGARLSSGSRSGSGGSGQNAPQSGGGPQGSFGSTAATHAAAAMRQRSSSNTTSPPQSQSQSQSQSSQAAFGSSAATQAFRSSNSVRRPAQTPVQSSSPQDSNREGLGSLSAAKSVMSAQRRPRSASTPTVSKESYPGESKATANALNAAAAAHRPSMQSGSASNEGGSSPYVSLPRSMFTSHPTIGPQADEQKKNDDLHATAVAMAKQMYSHQQRMADQTKAARSGAGDEDDADNTADGNGPKPYVNLQEAAYKLAQERLAKMEDEHNMQRYQDYYGGGGSAGAQRHGTLQRRFTMKGRLRRRSSSEGEIDDRRQSEKIREQMSIFSSNLSKVDEQKRNKDREAVLAAAQRNVRAQLQGMDDKVYSETGKHPPPRKLSEWELKAHEAAQAMHDSRNEHKGEVDMGGGMYLSREQVDAIASKKVQPVLDEINEKAAAERERQEALKAEAEAKRREEERQKEKERETKEANRKLKEEEKAKEREAKQHEKEEQKAKKDEERAARTEEKRLAKEEKRRSKAAKREAAGAGAGVDATAGGDQDNGTDSDENEPQPTGGAQPQPILDTSAAANVANDQGQEEQRPTSSHESKSPKEGGGSPTNKMRSWFRSHFHRPRGKSTTEDNKDAKDTKAFIGGASLNSRPINDNESTASLDNRADSMREVAMAGAAGREPKPEPKPEQERERSPVASAREDFQTPAEHEDEFASAEEVSPVSSDDEDAVTADERGRGEAERSITPPPRIKDPNEPKGGSPSRDSRFREII